MVSSKLASRLFPFGASMKGIIEFAAFLFVAVAWTATDWLARHARDLIFLLGFVSLIAGFAFVHISLALIVPGVLICGLIVLSEWRSTGAKGGGDA